MERDNKLQTNELATNQFNSNAQKNQRISPQFWFLESHFEVENYKYFFSVYDLKYSSI